MTEPENGSSILRFLTDAFEMAKDIKEIIGFAVLDGWLLFKLVRRELPTGRTPVAANNMKLATVVVSVALGIMWTILSNPKYETVFCSSRSKM